MIYEHDVNGFKVRTGDLICTRDGDSSDIRGKVWRLIGKFIPGEVDHIVVYTGPGAQCVEAGAKLKVIQFQMSQPTWDAPGMVHERGPLIDTFRGIAFPLAGKGFSEADEDRMRETVAAYCLDQARLGRPYNVNFFNSATDDAFYCSQLAYKAYLEVGIDLNTGAGVPHIPGTSSIIFPNEIWQGCVHTP